MINSQIGNELHVSSLIIQMDWCDRECNGCYIKKSQNEANFSLLESLLTELIDISPEISCDELILSFASGAGTEQDKFGRFNTSLQITSRMAFFLDQWPKEKRLVFGFKDIVDCVAFLGHHSLYLKDLLEKANIAMSDPYSIPYMLKIYKQLGIESKDRLIWNNLYGKDNPWSGVINLKKHQIYNIARKPVRTESSLFAVRSGWYGIKENITEDRCVSVSLDKQPCSAGTQSFHIWPDGNITGCPYRALDPKFEFPRPPANLDELVARIKYQQRHPDPLDYCPANPMNGYKGWNSSIS